MNFYKHHLGDYAKDTAHLSWMEDAAYTRLLRVYYLRERPIPSNLIEATRLVRAVTRQEKQAVTNVLTEFFDLQPDGYHNARADREIQQYQAQASTNRRIARERIVVRTVDESSTNHTPNHKPEPEPDTRKIKNKYKGNGSAQAPFVLPDWIPEPQWNAWVEARKKVRKAPTEYAKKLAVMKLENLKEQGHEPAQVLMQSAFNNWADLYPPKEARP